MNESNGNKKNGSKENETNNQMNISKLKMGWKVVTFIIGVLVGIYPVANYVHNRIYQIQCEQFYKIPRQYFSKSINDTLVIICTLAILLVMCFVPAFLRKYFEQDKTIGTIYEVVISVIIGCCIGFCNIYNIVDIMSYLYKKNWCIWLLSLFTNHTYIFTWGILLLGIILLIGITFYDKFIKKFSKKKNILFNIVFYAVTILNITLMVLGTNFKIDISIEDKNKYELVTVDGKEYFILSDVDNKSLVVEYSIDQDNNYYIYTDKYIFIDSYSGESYRFVDTCVNVIHQ